MHITPRTFLALGAALLVVSPASAQFKAIDDVLQGRSLAGQAIKGVAIGYAVKQSSKQLNKFINTVTLRNHVPQRLATKVVPVLSVGERGYIGGAQVAGPKALVDRVQAVWQYENEFNRGEYRIKALVPSSSLNPLQIRRVERVGLSALIDVSLGGAAPPSAHDAGIGAGRVLRAAVVAGAVLLAAKPLNQFVNTVTFNKDRATRVVPQASFGERGYIGGAQVTGSTSTVGAVKAVFEYWDAFDRGRYRIRALVPVNGVDPTRIRRVEGTGVLALIDTSIAAQERARNDWGRRPAWRTANPWLAPSWPNARRVEDVRVQRAPVRKDNGLHLGWEIGKHKGWLKNGGPNRDDRERARELKDEEKDRRKEERQADKWDRKRGRGHDD